MFVDRDGTCHILGFSPDATCDMKLFAKRADFEARSPAGRMRQHWELAEDGKTFTQKVNFWDKDGKPGPEWNATWNLERRW